VARCYDYLPFGEEIGNGTAGRTDPCFGGATYPAPQDIESAKFTGKQRDAETGLDFFGERYLSSAQGRFTSPDALIMKKEWLGDPQRWNRYSYVTNNPLKYVDPDGHDATIVYSLGDLSDEQREWFERNKGAIFAQIRAKLNDAGIRNVSFKDAASLSREDRQRLANSPVGSDTLKTGVAGAVRLEIGGERSAFGTGVARLTQFGFTNHGGSTVFLDRLFGSGGTNGGNSSCDAICGVANVAAHEIGHGLGFEAEGHGSVAQFFDFSGTEVFLRPFKPANVMDATNSPFRKPLGYAPDRNQKIIEEVNRANAFPR
jgi:RHS repeat-associated protein